MAILFSPVAGFIPKSFLMCDEERRFYEKLREYLEDGFNLARRKGNQGRALGFLMAIFQKIAASSFAAVRRTLMRRMLMLTLHEGLLRDRDLDIEGRERLYDEARELIHSEWNLNRDALGRTEADRVMADLKYRLAKKLDEEALEMASDPYGDEFAAAHAEDVASAAIDLASAGGAAADSGSAFRVSAKPRNEGSKTARRSWHALASKRGREDCHLRHLSRHRGSFGARN